MAAASAALIVVSTLIGPRGPQPAAAVDAGTTELISSGSSVNLSGSDASSIVESSSSPRGVRVISTTGRYVVFESSATNLVQGDTNNKTDIFVLDRDTGTVERVSVASDGTQSNGFSHAPSISGDGNVVAFMSEATNLVSGDSNGLKDVFVHYRDTGVTELVSVTTAGAQGDGASELPAISRDGTVVVYQTVAGNLPGSGCGFGCPTHIVLRDLATDTTEAISVSSAEDLADGSSTSPSLSADGKLVVFDSVATNLVTGDTNAIEDVFLRDRTAGTTIRLSVAADGTESGTSASATGSGSRDPAISADGLFVTFESDEVELLGMNGADPVDTDTTGDTGIFVVTLSSGSVEKLTSGADSGSFDPVISDDGDRVAFGSTASNLMSGDANGADDVFVYDRSSNSFVRRTGGTGSSGAYDVSISGDGRYVAFDQDDDAVVSGDANGSTDVFVTEVSSGTITRISLSSPVTIGNAFSDDPEVSDDGRWVAFESDATNLVSGDSNGSTDVFLYDRDLDVMARISVSSAGVQAGGSSPSMSADGRYIAFESSGALITSDTNGWTDVYVYDRETDTLERVSLSSAGVQGNSASFAPAISSDGRYVAFLSSATNLVSGLTVSRNRAYVYDRTTDQVEHVSVGTDGDPNARIESIALSGDGQVVALESGATDLVAGDTNAKIDIFVYDRGSGTTERVSVSSDEAEAIGPNISPLSSAPTLSADGRYVAFQSFATNLVTGDTNAEVDIFVRDRSLGTTERVSVTSAGAQAAGGSDSASISADGRYVAFRSSATDLVAGDTNALSDVFVHDRDTDGIERVSITSAGAQVSDGDSYSPTIARNGSSVVFASVSGVLAGSVSNDGQVFFHALVNIDPVVTPTPSPTPTPAATATPTASPTPATSPTPIATSTPDEPSPTAIVLPSEIVPEATPLVVIDQPIQLSTGGVVTRAVLVASGDVVLEIAAGTVVTGVSGPAAIIYPPVAREDLGLSGFTITTSAGDDVKFDPPILVTLAIPTAEASIFSVTAPSLYVPVEVGPNGSFGCLSGTDRAGGISFRITRPGAYALRGVDRPSVVRAASGIAGLPGFHSRWAGQSVGTTACTGQLVDITVLVKNTGTESWVHGTDRQVVLGSNAPRDSTRDYDSGVLYAPLYNRDRFATTLEPVVEPGQTATFTFRIRAPAFTGRYRVYLRPVVEGRQWLEDEGMYLEIDVR